MFLAQHATNHRWVTGKPKEEAERLYQEDPNETSALNERIPLIELDWDSNDKNNQSRLGLYSWEKAQICLVERLHKGVPKRKSLNMVEAVQQKPNKDPSVFGEDLSCL